MDNCLEYGNQVQAFAFKTKQNANKRLAPKFNIQSKARQKVAQPQGVKSGVIEHGRHHMINSNHSDKWFNTDTNQCVNSQSNTLYVNSSVECANRFAILANTEEVD